MACFGFVKVNCCNEHKQPFSKDAVKQRLFDVQRPGDPEKTQLRTWLNPSNPEICASSHNFGLYSPSGFKIQHTIAVYARWVPRFRHLRNPHETCTQTDWTLWHENFDQHQIARISQCSTGLQVQKCTQMNISGYRPWQYHTQTLKGESVARKTCKDQ